MSVDSATFVLPRRGWLKLHEHPVRSLLLLVAGIVTVVAGLVGAVRRVDEFQRLDFHASTTAEGYLVVSVEPAQRGGPRRPRVRGDVIVGARRGPGGRDRRPRARALLAPGLDAFGAARRQGRARSPTTRPSPRWTCATCWSRSRRCSRWRWPASSTSATRRRRPGRFLALAEALFAAVVVPLPAPGRRLLAAPAAAARLRPAGAAAAAGRVLRQLPGPHQALLAGSGLAFVPSLRSWRPGAPALAAGLLPPVVGDVLVPEALDARHRRARRRSACWPPPALSVRAYVEPPRRPDAAAAGRVGGARRRGRLRAVPAAVADPAVGRRRARGADLDLPAAAGAGAARRRLLAARVPALGPRGHRAAGGGHRRRGAPRRASASPSSTRRHAVRASASATGATWWRWPAASCSPPSRCRRAACSSRGSSACSTASGSRRGARSPPSPRRPCAHRDPETLLQRLAQLLRDALAVDQVVTYLALRRPALPLRRPRSAGRCFSEPIRCAARSPPRPSWRWWSAGCGTASPSSATGA